MVSHGQTEKKPPELRVWIPSPRQFVTRERITVAQQMIRAVTRNAAEGEARLSNAKRGRAFQRSAT